MTNKDLEGMLRAIQELKTEKYMGTKNAWVYLKRVKGLYENPVKIANAINEELRRNGQVYYKASPARIMGLGNLFYEICVSYQDWEEDWEEDKELGLNPDIENSALYFYDSHITSDYYYKVSDSKDISKVKGNPNELMEYLLPVFKDIQNPETTNSSFGIYAIDYSLNKYKTEEKKKEFVLEKAFNANWDSISSLDNLRNIERELKQNIFFNEINLRERILRMLNDKVDHRLENRREILTDWIDKMKNTYFNLEIDYDSFRKYLMEQYQERKKTLEELKSSNAPYVIIEDEEKINRESEFLLTALAPERNFVNRYLNS